MRPTKAVINLSNLRENYLNIRKHCFSSKIIPVIKADGYGHGALETAKALLTTDFPPELFAVAMAEEAVFLRKSGIVTPILVFENLSDKNISEHLEHSLIPTIADSEGLLLMGHLTADQRNILSPAVKVDTGMGRLGLLPEDTPEALRSLLSHDKGKIHSVYTHLATSDEEDLTYANLQSDRYFSLIMQLKALGIPYGFTHFSNSGGIHNLDQQGADFVRAGISLYGYYPSKFCNKKVPLKPAMSLVSEVATIRYFKAGESVSYGRKFIINEPVQIASVPVGYADGVPRSLSGQISVMIGGKLYSQTGTITMDRMMINCGNDSIEKHEKVTLFGQEGITADTWARLANTISYEITCGISKRVPREYI
ncbi:MAG: alanine racemase [Ignavibacteriaceae bacterium]|nr:alanine racemase [Ignavibacteriaceae bacterium]